MAVTQSQIEGLAKQVFILEYLLNGLFPCQSDVVRLIRANKREWKFNDKFEYRMLLSTTNSGGSLNSQVFKETVGLNRPGSLDYGIFQATYGAVSDGFDVDMTANLETKDKKAAFESDFAIRMHSLRTNVASLFKNFAIHGRFGVVHQLRATIAAGSQGFNPKANTGFTPVFGAAAEPFTIQVPINVFNSGFKKGKYLIKTKEVAPWGAADVSELYMILDNQPGRLTLISVGSTASAWQDGEFLEVAFNREITGAPLAPFSSAFWTAGGITSPATVGTKPNPWAGSYDLFTNTGTYTTGQSAVTGAMEGLADLFPWYTDPTAVDPSERIGTDLPFRGQTNRLIYTTEQCGGWIFQEQNEDIIDAIMRGAFLTKATVPYSDVGIWINPMTRQQMGYEAGTSATVIRDNLVEGPIIYQRGVKSTDYQIGNQVIREVVEDANLPTDVIIIGPKGDLSYNCWDNSTFEIDNYIQETWGKSEPPKIEDISIPDEFVAKLDLSNRITYGAPTLSDQSALTNIVGSGIRHPRNSMPIALHEMGALFTEYPYTYTIVKLREPIIQLGQ